MAGISLSSASSNMKAFLAVTAVLAFLCLSVRAGENMNEKVQKAFNKCKDKTNPPEADLEKMKNQDLDHPYARESKCLIACMLEEGKIMKDGKYNKENALIMSDVLHKDDAEDAAKAREVVEKCLKDHPNSGTDGCEFAYEMAICGGHESKRLGMKKTPDFFSP